MSIDYFEINKDHSKESDVVDLLLTRKNHITFWSNSIKDMKPEDLEGLLGIASDIMRLEKKH